MSKIKSIDDLEMLKNSSNPVVVLFSGGLDSTFLVVYLTKILSKKVIAVHVDIGQEEELVENNDLEEMGVLVKSIDARDEFVNDFVYPAILNQGIYLKRHPLSASLSRPLFAKKAMEIAKENNAQAIIHCATSTQNSLRRFNTTLEHLNFDGVYGSAFETSTPTRSEKIEFLKEYGIYFKSNREFSFDTNLWCREFESGNLVNPENIEIEEDNFLWTNECSENEQSVQIKIKEGKIVKINENNVGLERALELLNVVGGNYQIGRFCSLEEGPTGKKVIEVRECPGAVLLINSYWDLLSASVSAESLVIKNYLDELWTREACEGRWYGILKKSIEAFSTSISKKVSGTVRYKLSKNSFNLESVKSHTPQYLLERESEENVFEINKRKVA